jgi:hypothetical protein
MRTSEHHHAVEPCIYQRRVRIGTGEMRNQRTVCAPLAIQPKRQVGGHLTRWAVGDDGAKGEPFDQIPRCFPVRSLPLCFCIHM